MKTKGKSERKDISSCEKPSSKLGKIIKEAREKNKLTLARTAVILNISKEFLRLIENGKINSPGVDKIIDIFCLFNLNINILNEIFLNKAVKSRYKKLKRLLMEKYVEIS